MPKVEYRGILARPGAYKYKWGTEIKTYEELKKAFQRTPSLKLTLGHPMNPDGTPRIANENDFIGRVDAVFNDTKEVIEGIFKPYEEYWERIPEHIRSKIVNNAPYAISLGYPPPVIENGVQKNILYDHCAVLRDGEDPICPLGECGINVRVESGTGEHIIMRYEQATSTKDEEQPPEDVHEDAPQAEYVTKSDLERFKQDLFEMLQPKEPAGAAPVEEEKSEPVEDAEPEETPHQEPPLEPERAFPAGSTKARRLPYLKEDGSVEIPSEIYLGGSKK